MKKIKKVWKKLKYWQKGALFGLLFGILLHIYISIFKGGVYIFDIFTINTWLFHLIPIFLGPSRILFEARIGVANLIAILIWYSLIGLIIGLAYGYIKRRDWNNTKKIIIFILLVTLFLGIIIFLNYSLMGIIFSGIGT